MRVSKKAKSQEPKVKGKRGRPPLSAAEKARRAKERAALKAAKPKGKRGRPAKAKVEKAFTPRKGLLAAVEANPKAVDLAVMLVDFANRINALEVSLGEAQGAFQALQTTINNVNEDFAGKVQGWIGGVENRLQEVEKLVVSTKKTKPKLGIAESKKEQDEKENCEEGSKESCEESCQEGGKESCCQGS